jgi:hypothetical protein
VLIGSYQAKKFQIEDDHGDVTNHIENVSHNGGVSIEFRVVARI